jgi:carboxymethylenebutenolidase
MATVRTVELAMPDGRAVPAALAMPDGPPVAGRRAGVVVVHELLGLNDDIRRITARFADAGYVALAPDFFSGLGPRPICIVRFARGIGRVHTGRPYRLLAAAEDWLRARPEVDGAPIGVAGFCIGGGFALLHATGADIEAVAPFYAAVPRDEASLAGVCPVVASYGARDRVFGEGGPRLETALTRLGVEHDVRVYPGAGHSFMSRHGGLLTRLEGILPMHGGYVEEAAEDAWVRTLAFFDRHLGMSARG